MPSKSESKPGFRVVAVETAAELGEHVDAWKKLAANSIEPNPFYEPWMLLPAIEAFAGERPVVFVLIYQDGLKDGPRLCGFFPMGRERPGLLPVDVFTLWQHPHCFLCTPLLLEETAHKCLMTFVQWSARHSRGAPVVRWDLVSAEGPFQRVFGEFLSSRKAQSRVVSYFTRALFRAGENAEDYLSKTISGSGRRDFRRDRKKLEAMGKLEFRVLGDGDPEGEWVEKFIALEASGWKGRNNTALASNPAERKFFVEIARGAKKSGRLAMHGLFLDDKPIALRCSFRAGGGTFGFKLAFDEEYSRFSPGGLLELDCMESYHETPRMPWLDSCASPDSSFSNRLYNERRCLQSVMFGTGPLIGDLYVAIGPVLDVLAGVFRRLKNRP